MTSTASSPTLYRCVRDRHEELIDALRYVLNSREDFRAALRDALARDSPATPVQKASWFYQIIRYSYASGLTSYGSQPHDIRSDFPLIEQAHRRLKDVVVENKDFEKLIRQYDRPVSFFLLRSALPRHRGVLSRTLARRFLPKNATTSACGTRCCPWRAGSCSPTTTRLCPRAYDAPGIPD